MNIPKILLVDDTKLLLEMEKGFLANSPVQILTADNGKEALTIISQEKPDLVLLDQNMPVMNGISCLSAIRNNPTSYQIPVIMVSSTTSKEDHQAFIQAGCNDFLLKPLERHSFLSKVRKFLPVINQRNPRVPCRMKVQFEFGGQKFSGTSENVSLNGLFVASSCKVLVESFLLLEFSLPGALNDSTIMVRGRVAWINPPFAKTCPHLPEGFGVEFLEIVGSGLPLLRRNELRQYVESLLATAAKSDSVTAAIPGGNCQRTTSE